MNGYTQIVLTIIAIALVADLAREYIVPAYASSVQRVAICSVSGGTCATVSGSRGLRTHGK